MSGNVGSNISESGMVANVGVVAEIASLSVSVQLSLLSLSFLRVNFWLICRHIGTSG